MSNLKRDLVEKLIRDKTYLEMELGGLAQNTIISYKKKVKKMGSILNELAIINGTFSLMEVYFPEPVVAPEPVQEQSVKAPVQEQEVVNEPVMETPVEELVIDEPVEEPKTVDASNSPFPKIN